ncbi:nudix hydrolase 2 [Ziziphus jujuba]|uniref:Nudix hydrolase 2 n=1 Tax=Ziziphus jujuba TaxID=326968 RepID=A0A6P4A4Y9_ZIZJJ|nr:nudix hydrolase 2 [Ziziphus jujuba]
MFRVRPIKLIPNLLAYCKVYTASFYIIPSISKRPCLGSLLPFWLGSSKGPKYKIPSLIQQLSVSTSSLAVQEQVMAETGVELLNSVDDQHGGVRVEMKEPMDPKIFSTLLEASISHWRQQGKKGVWIKLPIELSSLVDTAVKEGFRYHHAESDYLMLVYWIPDTVDTLPVNATHRVGIGAFVTNHKREVLVVQETRGKFRGSGVWKLPTGVTNEGEDICDAAIREVKEETGIETEFVEVLAFRQSHQAFFSKSDLFFVCLLKPRSFDIEKQDSEIEEAQWMPVEEYAAQAFVQKHEMFNLIAKVCLAKLDADYVGFSAVPTTTGSGKRSYLYCNNHYMGYKTSSSNNQP